MKYLLTIAMTVLLLGAANAQEEGTRILYPRPGSTSEPATPEASTERVLYPAAPEPDDEPEEPAAAAPDEAPETYPETYPEPESDTYREPQYAPRPQEPYTYYSHRRPRRSQTLLGNRGRGSGGYAAFSVNAGEIGNQNAILIGGRGAWVMGGGFGMGFGGYVLANDVIFDYVDPGRDLQLEMAYGGLYLEPMIATSKPIHLSFPVLLGMGGAVYTERSFRYNRRFDWDRDVEDSDIFFVLEPGAYLEFHIVRFFRIGLGAQYRILSDLDLMNTASNAFNGWTAGLTLKFGNY